MEEYVHLLTRSTYLRYLYWTLKPRVGVDM